MIPKHLLARYELQSNKIQSELARLHQWMQVLPVGQNPPSYDAALSKLCRYQEQKLYKTWLNIRSFILADQKTLWMHFPYVTSASYLPTYAEINSVIEEAAKNAV